MKIVVQARRLVIFIDAEEGDIEVVTRVSKVVGIAAEEGGIELRREYQPDVSVLLVLVQVVHFSGIESHNVAAQAGGRAAVLLDRRHGRAFRLTRLRA